MVYSSEGVKTESNSSWRRKPVGEDVWAHISPGGYLFSTQPQTPDNNCPFLSICKEWCHEYGIIQVTCYFYLKEDER